MRRIFVRRAGWLVLALTITAFGCASPPEAEKKAAGDAVSAARAAGAEKYASADLAAALNALKSADTQMSAGKYSEAKAEYLKAKELADKAGRAVAAGKAAARSQVAPQIQAAEKGWLEIEGKVKAVAGRLKAEQQQAWQADAKGAADALQAAKAAVENDPLLAKDKLAAVTAVIDKWEAALKALPAPRRAERPKGK
jgi:hypothetical protein